MGVASFVIALVSFVSAAVCLIVAFAVNSSAGVSREEGSPITYVLGGWIYGTGVLSLVGIVFGIGGALQKDRRRMLAVLGLAGNICMPIGLMFILLLGLTLQNRPEVSAVLPEAAEASNANWPSLVAFFLLSFGCAGFVVARRRNRLSRRMGRSPMAATGYACPHCQKSLPTAASFCRRCGRDIRVRYATHADAA